MKQTMSCFKKLGMGIIGVILLTTSIEAATLEGLNQNNTTLVPLRIISEELGAQVNYEASKKEITISYKDSFVLTTIGSKKATVDGSIKELMVAPQIVNNTSYVPLRFIGEALGAIVHYDKGNLTITLDNQIKEWTLETTTNKSKTEAAQKAVQEGEFVATINGKPLTLASYKGYLFSVKMEMEEGFGEEIWQFDMEGETMENIAKERALETAVAMSITSEKAKEMKLKLSTQDKEEAKSIAANYMTQLKELLEEEGITENVIRVMMEDIITSQKVLDQLTNQFTPSENEDELQVFIEENKTYFEIVTAQHILVGITDELGNLYPEEKLKKIEEKAEMILRKALAGEDMGELAKEYSEDPGSKDTGGEYTFQRGEMVVEFEEAAFDGQAGKVFPKVVKTSHGYHIMKTIEKITAKEEEMKLAFEEKQKADYINGEIDEWITSAKVEKTNLYNKIKIRQ